MCEFTIHSNEEKVLEDVVFAIAEDKGNIVVRDIVGTTAGAK